MIIGATGASLLGAALSGDIRRGPHDTRFRKGSFRDVQDVRKGLVGVR